MGRGLDPTAALFGAIGEAVERHCARAVETADLVFASDFELTGESRVSPRDLGAYVATQYDVLPFDRFDPHSRLSWLMMQDALTDAPVLVPSQAVYLDAGMANEPRLFCYDSTGLAASVTREGAIWAAMLEVLERDALVCNWFWRLPPQGRLVLGSHPDAKVVTLVEQLAREGLRAEAYVLETTGPYSAVSAIVINDSRAPGAPQLVCGSAAAMTRADASYRALLEACQMMTVTTRWLQSRATRARRATLVAHPELVTTPKDHGLLHSAVGLDEPYWGCRIRDVPTICYDDGPGASLEQLVDSLALSGGRVLWRELTTPMVRSAGLRVVRAVVVGSQPMHFGWGWVRADSSRLSDFGVRHGLRRPGPYFGSADDLHPLA